MSKFVDLEEIIREWARSFPLDDKTRSKVDFDALSTADINLQRLRITHLPAEHSICEDPLLKQSQKSHVLFSSTFTNDTQSPQSYQLRTERKTRSTCKVILSRALTKGPNVSLSLSPPGAVVTANAGFKREVTLTNSTETNCEEELTWSLDTSINVNPGYRTTASLIIKEDEYDGTFKVTTSIEGRLIVTLRDKKDNSILKPIFGENIHDIFTEAKGFVNAGKDKVHFVNTGHCSCRYGIEQRVKLEETLLNLIPFDDSCDDNGCS